MKCLICSKKLIGRQTKFCSTKCKQKDINIRHQNYNKQSERGFLIKKKLVDIKGGKCQVCGYNKNYSALCFHHKYEKDFQLDIRKCANTNWETLLAEANKCVVLCHNCHMEEHYPQHKNVVRPEGFEPPTPEL